MARPRASAEQQKRAYDLFNNGFTVSSTHLQLETEFDNPVSRGTVGNWFKGFKQGGLLQGKADEPFRWAEMGNHEIPYEAGAVLLKIVSVLPDCDEPEGYFETGSMSFRDAKWAWRVYQALDGNVSYIADPCDVIRFESELRSRGEPVPCELEVWLLLSSFFSASERAERVAGIHVDTTIREDELTFRPWESDENFKRHNELIDRGLLNGITDPDFDEPDVELERARQIYGDVDESSSSKEGE